MKQSFGEYEIIIDKDGMRAEESGEVLRYQNNNSIYQRFIENLIDLGEWKHSWYVDVGKAQYKDSSEHKKCREIILDKIKEREGEIQTLKNGLLVLGHWH